MLSEKTRLDAAHALGMKTSEIVAVGRLDDGAVVETHDGQRVLVAADGSTSPYEGPMPAEEFDEVDELENEGLVAGEDDEVPEGSADMVLAWVGDDRDRARRALEVENAGQKRSTLITKLEKLAQA